MIQPIDNRFSISNYPKLFVIKVKMWHFMKTLSLLKINLKAFATAFEKASVLHFLDATINLVPDIVLCIFGSQYVFGSVLKSLWTFKPNLQEKVMLSSITSSKLHQFLNRNFNDKMFQCPQTKMFWHLQSIYYRCTLKAIFANLLSFLYYFPPFC